MTVLVAGLRVGSRGEANRHGVRAKRAVAGGRRGDGQGVSGGGRSGGLAWGLQRLPDCGVASAAPAESAPRLRSASARHALCERSFRGPDRVKRGERPTPWWGAFAGPPRGAALGPGAKRVLRAAQRRRVRGWAASGNQVRRRRNEQAGRCGRHERCAVDGGSLPRAHPRTGRRPAPAERPRPLREPRTSRFPSSAG